MTAGLCYRDLVLSKEDGVAHSYFDRPAASPHDAMLAKQIGLKVVPPTCLLGGVIVAGLHGAGIDPCSDCDGPRNRCGGRTKASAQAVGRGAALTAQDFPLGAEEMPAHVRATFRTLQVQELRKMLDAATAARDERNRSWQEEPPQ